MRKKRSKKKRKKRGNIEIKKKKWRVKGKTESKKTRSVVKTCTNMLLISLPLNRLLSSKNLEISHLDPFFQSEQFLWQDFPHKIAHVEEWFPS